MTEDTTQGYNKAIRQDSFGESKTMTVAVQGTVGIVLSKVDWLEDTDEEIDEQKLEAHYSYMAKIQEVSPAESSSTNTPLEQRKTEQRERLLASVRDSSSDFHFTDQQTALYENTLPTRPNE
ncbi:hypothetical protein Tco_0031759 [Tanacetum coccineum]